MSSDVNGERPEVIVGNQSEVVPVDDDANEPREAIEHPAKVMRIGTMIKQLLEEVRQAPLDDRSRIRMREIYETSVRELGEGLSQDLRDELNRLASPFDQDQPPSDSELRIAQAQLVGWLEGIFHGLQASYFAQQAAVRGELEQRARRGLPQGNPETGETDEDGRPGTYL